MGLDSLSLVRSGRAPAGDVQGRRFVTVGQALFIAIVAFAFLIRIWDVGGRVMHLDESTVAWFGWQLLTGHGYAYDPVYHGPFQHEMLALLFLVFGQSQTTARLLAVVLGTGLVALPWFIRDYLGRAVALWTCFLIAISPSFVYFARFERDDTYMEFFTVLVVVFALRFLRDRHPWQLYGAVIAFTLAFATKESIYIVAFVFATYLLWVVVGARAGRWLAADSARARNYRNLSQVVRPALLFGCLLVPLAAAVILTIETGFYLPVPLVLTATLVGGVVTSSAGWTLRRTSIARTGTRPTRWMWSAAWRGHWLSALTISLGILVLMYSTFGTNLNGIWDRAHPFFNSGNGCQFPLAFNLDACRRDVVGGLFYWLSQHKVARGHQPWYYFLLIFGLYEQIALVFGAIGGLVTYLSRRLRPGQRTIRMFVVYWAAISLLVYSWAGEKFPWLGIHPLLPITLLAAFGINDTIGYLGRNLRRLRRPRPAPRRGAFGGAVAGAGALLLGVLLVAEAHNTVTLNFVNGANPVEMMVYVQSSPDTLADANLIGRLSHRATDGNTLPVSIDSLGDGAWPFAWYLRNMPDVGYPSGASGLSSRDPIIILQQTDADGITLPKWLTAGYSRRLRRFDWWFPEDYKQWTWSSFLTQAASLNGWNSVWQWETTRKPFGIVGSDWYYLYVKKGYFPAF